MKIIDTRKFSQIWMGLSKEERFELRVELERATGRSERMIRFWAEEKRHPQVDTQTVIAISLKKVLGIVATPQTLFPC